MSVYPKIDVSFDNHKAFVNQLNQLEADIRDKARYSGVVEMAKPLKKRIKVALGGHIVSGALQASIGHRKIPKSFRAAFNMQTGDVGVYVGAVNKQFHGSLVKKRSQAYKMHFLEEGTAPHKIRAKKGGVLRFKGLSVKQVNHPGVRARHILQRANAGMQGQYLKYFAIGAQRALKRHGVKLA